MSNMRDKAQRRKLRYPPFQDVQVKRIGYRRALKQSVLYSVIASISGMTSISILGFILTKLDVFKETTGQLFDFAVRLTGVDHVSWSWSWLFYIIPAFILLNMLLFILATSFLVWLFNMGSALSGGIVLRFEIVDDPL